MDNINLYTVIHIFIFYHVNYIENNIYEGLITLNNFYTINFIHGVFKFSHVVLILYVYTLFHVYV